MLDANATVVVTGGAGFIGSHIAERLLRSGAAVRVLDDFSTGSRETASELERIGAGRCRILEGDIRDPQAVAAAMDGATHVVHEAALPSVQRSVEDPVGTSEVNVMGTVRLLDEARKAGVQRFVFAGSSSVYGDQPELPKRESMPPQPKSPYALTKLTGEVLCTQFHELYGFPTVVLRYFNVFGPRQNPDSQYAAVIPLFIRAILRGERPTVFGDGRQTRDFTYIDNVVHANLLALEAPAAKAGGKVLNIACGDRISLLDLLEALGGITGRRANPIFEPARPGDVRDSQAAVEQAVSVLGFEPQVGLQDGLARTTEWFRTRI